MLLHLVKICSQLKCSFFKKMQFNISMTNIVWNQVISFKVLAPVNFSSTDLINLHRSFDKEVIQSAPFCAKSQSKDPIIVWSSRLDNNNVLTFQWTFLHIGNISTSLANIKHFIIIVCYIKGFRKRWFTLDGQDLTYYKAPEKTVCDKHNLMLN